MKVSVFPFRGFSVSFNDVTVLSDIGVNGLLWLVLVSSWPLHEVIPSSAYGFSIDDLILFNEICYPSVLLLPIKHSSASSFMNSFHRLGIVDLLIYYCWCGFSSWCNFFDLVGCMDSVLLIIKVAFIAINIVLRCVWWLRLLESDCHSAIHNLFQELSALMDKFFSASLGWIPIDDFIFYSFAET